VSIIHKKGSVLLCDNYRGLSLLNHDGKALERVILNILTRGFYNFAIRISF
jgi:hypothetical protein